MERPTRYTALWNVTHFECMRCLDTALILKDGELFDCPNCRQKDFAHKERIAHLELLALKQPAASLDERTFDTARAFVLTNLGRPLKLDTLERFLNCPVPEVLTTIARLQAVWKLPIRMATENPPAYCWAF